MHSGRLVIALLAGAPRSSEKREDRLKQIVVDVLRVWLQPLREISAQPIVDDFQLLLQPDYEGTKDRVPAGLDTRITFPVREGFFLCLD